MNKKIKILHLEDSLKDSELIQTLIESEGIAHDYFFVDNEKDYIKILEKENIDLILSDFSMPDYNGDEVLKFARKNYSHIPFIFVSGAIEKDAAIHAMLNGASDCVLKEKPERLVPAINKALNVYENNRNRKQAEEALSASETRYRRLFESAKDGILILDAETGKITDVNPFLIELLGYSKEQFLEKEIWEIGFFKDIIANHDKFLELQEQEYVRYEDLPLETSHGRKIYVEFVSNVYLVNNQKVIQCNIRDITERKLAEVELKKSDEEFRAIFEQAGVGVAMVNTKTGQFIRVNQKYCDMVGYTMQEMIQKTFMDVTYPEDIQNNVDNNVKFLEGNNANISFEKRYVHKDGNIIWGNLTISPLWKPDEKTQTYFHIAIVENITKRKQAEEALKESERNLKEAQKIGKIGNWEFDFATQKIKWSDQVFELYERDIELGPPEEEEEEAKYYTEKQAKELKDFTIQSINTGLGYNYVVEPILPSGRKVYYSSTMRPVKDKNGKTIKLFGTIQDITERKLAEKLLQEGEDLFRAVLNSAPISIFATDNKGVFTLHEGKALQKIGMKPGENVGLSAFDLFSSLQIIEIAGKVTTGEDAIKRVLGGETVACITELNNVCFDNQFAPLLNTQGQVIGIVGVATDITVRRLAEEALQQSEKKFQNYIENAPDGIYIVDETGQYIETNKAACDILGYAMDEIINFNILDLVAEESLEDALVHFKKVNETGKATSELLHKHKDGSTRWLEINAVKLSQTRVLGFANDITERKLAEEKVKGLAKIIENSLNEVYVFDTESLKFLFVNNGALNNLGYTQNEILLLTPVDIKPEYSYELFLHTTNPLLTGEIEILEFETIHQRKDGSVYNVEVHLQLTEYEGKKVFAAIILDITERKKEEEKLHKALEKYKELFEASNDIIYTMDLKGNFTSVSPSAEKLLGYKLETLSNKNMTNFISEESSKIAFENITKKLNGDESNTVYEVGFNNLWGYVTDLEINSMIRYKEGQPIEVFGIARDITEKNKFAAELLRNHDTQKVINELLRESLKKIPLNDILYKALESLVSLSWLALDKKGAIFLTDSDGNLSMKVYYGLSEAVINECKIVTPGKCICGKVLKEKKTIYLSKIDHTHDVNYQGMIDHGHYCIPIMDGENVLGLINTYLAPGHLYSEFEVEFITAVANTLSGIITRKKTENELQVLLNTLELRVKDRTEDLFQSNELYLTTVDSLHDWICVINEKHNIVFVNQILKDFLINNGITADVTEKNIKDVFAFLSKVEFENFGKVFANGKAEIYEGEYTVFGKKYFTHIKVSPVISNNRVIRAVITIHDQTKLKLIEEEITKNLEREKELNALKSQFISTVSHEFRTPLAGILSSTQLLKRYDDKWDNAKKEEKYRQIFNAIKHTISLLDDVSLVNKGESNTITIKPVMADLKELLLGIIEENKHMYDPDFEIVTTLHLTQTEYFFDREIIRHIFGNVISNALKYSGNSKKIIFNVAEEKENILFNVIDYGIGIPLDDQKFMFEPFHRASNVEAINGTGFGLSIVKRFVDLLNGTIEIKSEIGKGTTVNIKLPILKIPEKENVI